MHASDVLRIPVSATGAREYLVLVPMLNEGNVMRLVVGVKAIKEKRWVNHAAKAALPQPFIVLAER